MSVHGPKNILVAPGVFAMMQTAIKYQGRDWRRVKREMRKAWDAAKRMSNLGKGEH